MQRNAYVKETRASESTDPGITDVLEQRNKLLHFVIYYAFYLEWWPDYESVEQAAYSFFACYRIASLATITCVRVDGTKELSWIFKQTGCGDFHGNLSRSVTHNHNHNHDYVWLWLCV